MKIVIVDYDTGNVNSIVNMLKKIGFDSEVTSDIELIDRADKLILPGVGSFDTGVNNLKKKNLIEILNKKVIHDKTPILGICLGMQLLGKKSSEGELNGFGWVDFEAVKFDLKEINVSLKVPHMSWNDVKMSKKSALFENMHEESRFYFVHSYFFKETDDNKSQVLTTTTYGHEFVSSIEKENIFGVQFHPEKSHKYGMKLLENYVKI